MKISHVSVAVREPKRAARALAEIWGGKAHPFFPLPAAWIAFSSGEPSSQIEFYPDMQIHLQRIVGAYVSSAYGAAQFYGNKVSDARRLTVASENDERDEDRGGVAGFESKGERARLFAAEMGLQSFALLAAAEGAVSAYAHITGDEWKPYEAPSTPASNVQRRSAQAEMDAFGS